MAESVSKLRDEIMSLTGVDIMLDADNFKSTYQIVKELAAVWGDLSDITRANVLNLVGGKRNANVVTSLLTNFSDAEAAMKAAMEATGSAAKENEAYLDSIQGKLAQLTASFQELSNSLISSGAVKFFVDLGNGALNFLNLLQQIHMLIPAIIAAFSAGRVLSKSFNWSAIFGRSFSDNFEKVVNAGVGGTLKRLGGTVKASLSTTSGLITAWAGGLTLAFGLVHDAIEGYNQWIQSTIDKSNEIVQSQADATKTYNSNIQTINNLKGRFYELTGSIDENKEHLGLSESQYEEYLSIVEQLVDISPSIARGYTAEEYAIKNYRTAIVEATNAQKEFIDNANQIYLGGGRELFEGKKNEFSKSYDVIRKNVVNTLLGYSFNGDTTNAINDALYAIGAKDESDKKTFYGNVDMSKLIEQRKAFIQVLRSSGEFEEKELTIINLAISELSDYQNTLDSVKREEADYLSTYLKDRYGESADFDNATWNALSDGLLNIVDPFSDVYANIDAAEALFEDFVDAIKETSVEIDDIGEVTYSSIIDMVSSFDGSSETAEEELNAITSAMQSFIASIPDENLRSVIENAFNNITPSIKAVGDESENTKQKVDDLSDSLKKYKDWHSLLQTAQDEMNSGKGLSVETTVSLSKNLGAGENISDYLYVENGILKLNVELWQERSERIVAGDIDNIQKNISLLEEENTVLEDEYDRLIDRRDAIINVRGKYTLEEIQSQIDQLTEYSKTLDTEDPLYNNYVANLEQWETLYAIYTDDLDAVNARIDANTSKYNANAESIQTMLDELIIYSSVSDTIGRVDFTKSIDGIEAYYKKYKDLADLQMSLLDGGELTTEQKIDFARLYPEAGMLAAQTADDQLAIVNDTIAAQSTLFSAFIEGLYETYSSMLSSLDADSEDVPIIQNFLSVLDTMRGGVFDDIFAEPKRSLDDLLSSAKSGIQILQSLKNSGDPFGEIESVRNMFAGDAEYFKDKNISDFILGVGDNGIDWDTSAIKDYYKTMADAAVETGQFGEYTEGVRNWLYKLIDAERDTIKETASLSDALSSIDSVASMLTSIRSGDITVLDAIKEFESMAENMNKFSGNTEKNYTWLDFIDIERLGENGAYAIKYQTEMMRTYSDMMVQSYFDSSEELKKFAAENEGVVELIKRQAWDANQAAESFDKLKSVASNTQSGGQFISSVMSEIGTNGFNSLSTLTQLMDEVGQKWTTMVNWTTGVPIINTDALIAYYDAEIDQLDRVDARTKQLMKDTMRTQIELDKINSSDSKINGAISNRYSYDDNRQITMADYDEMVAIDSRFADTIEYQNGVLTVNRDKYDEVTAAILAEESAQAKANALAIIASEEYQRLANSTKQLTAEEQAELDRMNDKINRYAILATEIDNANSAYQRFLRASDDSDAEMFSAAQKAYKVIQDTLYNKDSDIYQKIGREQYSSAIEFLIDPRIAIDPNSKGFKEAYKTIERYLKDDDDGVRNFVSDLLSKGFIDKATGVINANAQEMAKSLGISVDFLRTMFEEYNNFVNDENKISIEAMFDTKDADLNKVGEDAADGVASGIAEAEITDDANTFANKATEAIDDSFDDGELRSIGRDVANGIGEGILDADMSSYAESFASKTETDLRTAFDSHSPAQRVVPIGEDVARGVGVGMTNVDMSEYAGELASSVENGISESFSSGESDIQDLYEELDYITGEINKLAQSRDELAKAIENAEYDGNVDLLNRKIIWPEEMVAAGWKEFAESGNDYATLYGSTYTFDGNGDGIEVVINATPILPDGTVLSPDALESYLDTLAHEAVSAADVYEADKQSNGGLGIVLKAGVALDEESLDGVIDDVASWGEGALHQLHVDYSLFDYFNLLISDIQEAIREYEEFGNAAENANTDVTVTTNADEVSSQLSDVLTKEETVSGSSLTPDASPAVTAINNINSVLESTIQLISRLNSSRISIGSSVKIPTLSGKASASGTHRAKGGTTLVGELGMETVVDPHNNTWYTVGNRGAEFADLPEDAIVFNAEQTKKLFGSGHIKSRGRALASGNAAASIEDVFSTGGAIGAVGIVDIKHFSGPRKPGSDSGAKDLEKLLDEIKEKYDAIDKQISHLIEHQDQLFDESVRALDYNGMLSSMTEHVSLYRQQIDTLDSSIKEMLAAGADDSMAQLQDLEKKKWGIQKEIFDVISNMYSALNKEADNTISHYEQIRSLSERGLDYNTQWDALIKEAEAYQQIMKNSQNAIADLMANGATAVDDAVVQYEQSYWNAQNNLLKTFDEINGLYTGAINTRIDDMQSAYSILLSASDEFNNSGSLSLDTFQKLMSMGVEYMSVIDNVNGEYVINKDALEKLLEAEKEQLAIETAISYINQVKEAYLSGNAQALQNLADLNIQVSSTTWDAVEAQLALLETLGMEADQLSRIRDNVNMLRPIAGATTVSLDRQDGVSELTSRFQENKSKYSHRIDHDEYGIMQAQRGLDYKATLGYLEDEASIYKDIIAEAQEAINELFEQGKTDVDDEVQEFEEALWDAEQKLYNTLDKISSLHTDYLQAEIDNLQTAYNTLDTTCQEFNTTGGISIDTFQALSSNGLQYLSVLEMNDGQLVINEGAVRALIAAEKEQLAVEQALSYVGKLKEAALAGQEDAIENLTSATVSATESTRGLVYSSLSELKDLLTEEQYDAAVSNVDKYFALADAVSTSVDSISGSYGRTANAAKDSSSKQQESIDYILKKTEELVKYETKERIDSLKEQAKQYKELVDLKKDMIKQTKEEGKYEDKVAEKVKEIAKLQAQVDKLALDSSREAAAQRAKLMEDLAEKQKDLNELQADNAYDAQMDALDKMVDDNDERVDKEIEAMENSISSEEKVFQLAVQRISNEWDTLYGDLIDWNTEAGNTLNQEITEEWNKALAAAKQYGDYLTALAKIDNIYADGVKGAPVLDTSSPVINNQPQSFRPPYVDRDFASDLGNRLGTTISEDFIKAFTPKTNQDIRIPQPATPPKNFSSGTNAVVTVNVTGPMSEGDARRTGTIVGNAAAESIKTSFERKGIISPIRIV